MAVEDLRLKKKETQLQALELTCVMAEENVIYLNSFCGRSVRI